jgi:hypothetical protein
MRGGSRGGPLLPVGQVPSLRKHNRVRSPGRVGQARVVPDGPQDADGEVRRDRTPVGTEVRAG